VLRKIIRGEDAPLQGVLDWEVVPVKKKGPVLVRARFGCLSSLHSLNITRGCSFDCIYCYARSFTNSPPRKTVYLYQNLVQELTRQLDSPFRKTRIKGVVFNTASDCFQPHPDILKATFEAMETILLRGIDLHVLTKGVIPKPFFGLFSDHLSSVKPSIGLVPDNPVYKVIFEPNAPSFVERLKNIENLNRIGYAPGIRMDPLIPFLTDQTDLLELFFKTLKGFDVGSITVSYIHLRPAIRKEFQYRLPELYKKIIQLAFPSSEYHQVGTSTLTRLIPVSLRHKGYQKIKDIAHHFGFTVRVCQCKNPDLQGDLCYSDQSQPSEENLPEQLPLFT